MTYLGLDWRITFFITAEPTDLPPMVHEHRVWVNCTEGQPPGGDADSYILEGRSGAPIEFNTFASSHSALIAPLYSTDALISRAELWAAESGTKNFTYYCTQELADAGTSGNPDVACMQGTLTFRPQLGSWGKLIFMELAINTVLRQEYPSSFASVNAMAASVIDADSPIIHRTKGYYIARIAYSGNINDELEKIRYR